MTEWWDYVTRIAGTDEHIAIAAKSGIGTSVLSRWSHGTHDPSAQMVVTFARAYNRPPVEALTVAGYITANEAAEAIEITKPTSSLTNDELLAEIRRRMVVEVPTVTRKPSVRRGRQTLAERMGANRRDEPQDRSRGRG
jgi:transcriptional regulator with XRE-family HTH domain